MTEHKLYKGEITILFDDSLGFNGKPKHAYYILEGEKKRRLCGVTTYLNIVDKSQVLIPWAVRTTVEYIRKNLDQLQNDPKVLLEAARQESDNQKNIAGEIGSAIHSWIEKHIKGEQPEMPEDDKVLQGVNSFLQWIDENKVEFIESEKIVYSRKYDYIGTLDIIAKINGGLYLLDIKTGNSIYPEYKMQTAAYLKADMEERGTKYDGRIILRISKETEEEYKERMNAKNLKNGYTEYKVFEAVYLDDKHSTVHQDFCGFKNCIELVNWKKEAVKSLK